MYIRVKYQFHGISANSYPMNRYVLLADNIQAKHKLLEYPLVRLIYFD